MEEGIIEARRKAALEAAFHNARALAAWVTPEFFRVAGRVPGRWRWRMGINVVKAAHFQAAAAIYASLSRDPCTTRDPSVIRPNDDGR